LFLTVEKGAEFDAAIAELTDVRAGLEERYFSVRAELSSARDGIESAREKAKCAEDLLERLRTDRQDELSDKLISLSGEL
jgi:chromosome segregation ATPase